MPQEGSESCAENMETLGSARDGLALSCSHGNVQGKGKGRVEKG